MSLQQISQQLLHHSQQQAQSVLAENDATLLCQELACDMVTPSEADFPFRPLLIKSLIIPLSLMTALCVGGYLLTGKWQLARQEQLLLLDPLGHFSDEQLTEKQLITLQTNIRANPQDSMQWAMLGEYYLWRNAYHNALLAYEQALRLRGENAEIYSAIATVLYYQAGQHMTPATREMIDKALVLDAREITALMLLASDAFMQADYAQAILQWQTVLDLNSPRVNRTQLIDSINMAKMLRNSQK